MNREIKFRAWNRIDKVMIDKLGSPKMVDGKLYFDKDDIPMQYTGLKDKNGKEIYEGDIVKRWSGKICEVVYEEDRYSDDGELGIGFNVFLDSYGESHTEVLGNIYENPELLEKEK